MNFFNKIMTSAIPFRVVFGGILIAIGFCTSNPWFYLGIIPVIVGITNFCPLCLITKKCPLPKK